MWRSKLGDGKRREGSGCGAPCSRARICTPPCTVGTPGPRGLRLTDSATRTPRHGGGRTIHDNRGICAHAGICTDRLTSVFRYRQEPWIVPDGVSVEEIVEIVRGCPSGALSYSIEGVEQCVPLVKAARSSMRRSSSKRKSSVPRLSGSMNSKGDSARPYRDPHAVAIRPRPWRDPR